MPKASLSARPSIFRRTDRAVPEVAEAETAGRSDTQMSRRQRVRATVYLEPEDVVAIDRMQTEEFLRTGKKPERSELVSRAIKQLAASRQT